MDIRRACWNESAHSDSADNNCPAAARIDVSTRRCRFVTRRVRLIARCAVLYDADASPVGPLLAVVAVVENGADFPSVESPGHIANNQFCRVPTENRVPEIGSYIFRCQDITLTGHKFPGNPVVSGCDYDKTCRRAVRHIRLVIRMFGDANRRTFARLLARTRGIAWVGAGCVVAIAAASAALTRVFAGIGRRSRESAEDQHKSQQNCDRRESLEGVHRNSSYNKILRAARALASLYYITNLSKSNDILMCETTVLASSLAF